MLRKGHAVFRVVKSRYLNKFTLLCVVVIIIIFFLFMLLFLFRYYFFYKVVFYQFTGRCFSRLYCGLYFKKFNHMISFRISVISFFFLSFFFSSNCLSVILRSPYIWCICIYIYNKMSSHRGSREAKTKTKKKTKTNKQTRE